ncbi:Spy/CpxP family protein refolding chaperone [Glaciimonas sp. Gout2]|uniref:Spy/CpxP family protein refolding chaperone n=1 Tax=unclassified Glaciimonas TaxID=2644401 RepID=UPI002AB3E7AB|nr:MULTISPECIES: Spy/CpxP family protein refolding chaperone [unclassified Glaciimonas]MDY7548083.1 Spy/CpxP family protein refolding chaperone [Glaciimonas sp. CA11.2]MEB0010250.1 Spy/CpxP family protein refolding chaperone [Glaciimonas sp. Cout2]MEB0083749.1 Spy/CpxP family protein refolding chaperone [Glaciimonas sp. Gout2]
MNKSIITACLLSGLLIAGTASYAVEQGTQPAVNGTKGSARSQQDAVPATQKRLTELKQKLNLKSSQQTAWDTFSSGLAAQATLRAQSKEKMKSALGPDYENLSTPEKMEKMVIMMRSNADFLSKTASITRTFYDGLSTEQKTIFDLFAKTTWTNRMKEQMR